MQNETDIKKDFGEVIGYLKENNAEVTKQALAEIDAQRENTDVQTELIKELRTELAKTVKELRKDKTVSKEEIKAVISEAKKQFQELIESNFTKEIVNHTAEFLKEQIVDGVTEGNKELIEALTPDSAAGLVEPKSTMTPWPTPKPETNVTPPPIAPTQTESVSPTNTPKPSANQQAKTGGNNILTVFRTDSSGKVKNRKELNVKKQAGFVTAISDDSKIIEWLEKIHDAIKASPGLGGSLVAAMKKAIVAPFKAIGNFISAPIKALQSKIVAIKDAALAPFKKGWDFIKGIGAKLTDSLKAGINKVKNVFGFGTVTEDQFRLKSVDYYKKSLKWQKSIGRKFDNLLKLLSKQKRSGDKLSDKDDKGLLGTIGGFVTPLLNAISKGFTGLFSVGGKLLTSLGGSLTSLFSTLFKMGGPILGVLGAAFAGWKIGELIVKPLVDDMVKYITGDATATLGTALYDMMQAIKKRLGDFVASFVPGGKKPDFLMTDEEKEKASVDASKKSKVQNALMAEYTAAGMKPHEAEKKIKEIINDPAKLDEEYKKIISAKTKTLPKSDATAAPTEAQKPETVATTNPPASKPESTPTTAAPKPETKEPIWKEALKNNPMMKAMKSMGMDLSGDVEEFLGKMPKLSGVNLDGISKEIETHQAAQQAQIAKNTGEAAGGSPTVVSSPSTVNNNQTVINRVETRNFDNTYMSWVNNTRRNAALAV